MEGIQDRRGRNPRATESATATVSQYSMVLGRGLFIGDRLWSIGLLPMSKQTSAYVESIFGGSTGQPGAFHTSAQPERQMALHQ